jgi:hypothetical protein
MDAVKLADKYRDDTSISLGKGQTALFWIDKWPDKTLQKSFPRLFSFALSEMVYVQFLDSQNSKWKYENRNILVFARNSGFYIF